LILILIVLDMMLHNVLPDKVCFLSLAQACAQTGDATHAKILFSLASSNKLTFVPNVIECTQLIKAFSTELPDLGSAFEVYI
jgi:hypothetical protein